MARILLFLLLSIFCTNLVAQDTGSPVGSIDYKEVYSYENWYKSEKTPGYVYFLVTADWCAPCQVLLEKLKEANMQNKVIYVDFDKESRAAKLFTGGQGIPFLVRYEMYYKDGDSKISLRGKTVCKDRRYLEFLRGR